MTSKWLLLSFLGDGIAFWISDLVVPALNRQERGYVVTAACPTVLILFYLTVLRLRTKERGGPSTAIFAIYGVWILALSFILLAQRIRGGPGPGLTRADFGYLLVSSFLPWRIALFVTLEGSIIALWLGTAAMLIGHLVFERSRWIIPPHFRVAIRHRTS